MLIGNVRNFLKIKQQRYLIKYYTIQESQFFMFSAYFIFVVLHLKIHPVLHLNASKALTSL